MERNPGSIELRLPSRLGYEKVAMTTAASVAKMMGFTDERVEDLKTAVAEACINAIEHGNKLDNALTVGVVLSMDEHSLQVTVTDNGEGAQGTHDAPDIDKKMHGEEAARGNGDVSDPEPGGRGGVGELAADGKLCAAGDPSSPYNALRLPELNDAGRLAGER